MKLSKQNKDYQDLKQAIENKVSEITIENSLEYKKRLTQDTRVKDLEKRFRWDLFWAIPREIRQPIIDRIYQYANDDHMDTALKHIVNSIF